MRGTRATFSRRDTIGTADTNSDGSHTYGPNGVKGAIRKRTANLRAIRLAKEAADRANPVEAKAKPKKKKST